MNFAGMELNFIEIKLSQFQLARLKLTGLYLLIIMVITILFSVAIFQLQENELQHRFIRLGSEFGPSLDGYQGQTVSPTQIVDESLGRLKLNLFYIDLLILLLSAGAGYFLAGRTLQPIKKSMDEQSRFIADASHEIRTPLTALKTSTEVALRDKNPSARDLMEFLNTNLKKINEMQTLSEALLVLARDGTVGTSTKKQLLLSDILQEALRKLDIPLTHKKINIKLDSKNYKILGDEKSLVDLMVLLLDNAIKYSKPGGTVEVTSKKTDHQIQLKIRDEGTGISEEDLPHIFDRFYRADKSRSQDIPGYGLGLSIAKKIAEEHAGSISVTSTLGQGATFIVIFPSKTA